MAERDIVPQPQDWSLADVSTHAEAILQRLEDGTMPSDGAWLPQRIAVFRRWVAAGKPATAVPAGN